MILLLSKKKNRYIFIFHKFDCLILIFLKEKAPKAAKNSPTKKRKAAEEAESSEEMNEDFDDIIKSPAKKAKGFSQFIFPYHNYYLGDHVT